MNDAAVLQEVVEDEPVIDEAEAELVEGEEETEEAIGEDESEPTESSTEKP